MADSKMELEDWLDDLCVRFIINLPAEDLSSVARICFQVEEAQWFYEDFIRPLDPTLPSMSLRSFCLRIFQHCPLLSSFSVENHMRAFDEFLQYKTRVPVRGAIMLNDSMDSTVLVKGWKKGANWSFPRGKINKDEDDLDCAIREVYEETGFDIRAAGLVPRAEDVKYIEINMREQQLRLYVFRNVPMDTHFEPKTRKEISKIQWYKLSELPAFRKKGNQQQFDEAAASNANKFYMVAPFLVPLKKWVVQQKKRDNVRSGESSLAAQPIIYEEPATEDDMGMHVDDSVSAQIGAMPAIETFEGATRELQRRLQVQPPPGTQETNSEPASNPGQDKGNALLALLQSGGKGAVPQAQEPLSAPSMPPSTPLDHILSSAVPPQPPTPHHHDHIRQLQHNAPPPTFPLGPHSTENQPFASQLPGFPARQVPNVFQGHGPPPNGGSSHPNLPNAGRSVSGPFGQPHPFHQFQRGAPPQPGVVPGSGSASGPAAFANQIPQGLRSASASIPFGQPSDQSKPMPELSSHSMSLLSALRGNIGRPTDLAPAHPQVPEPTAKIMQFSQPPPAPNASLPLLDQALGMAAHLRPLTSDNQAQASAKTHKDALLGIFKSQTMGNTTQASLPISNLDGATSSSSGLQSSSLPKPSRASPSAEKTGPATQASAGPAHFDPTPNLPFGAVKLLNRPQGLERGTAPTRPPFSDPDPDPSRASAVGIPAILPGQQQQQPRAAPRPSEATPEQKTLLLSLFGKPQAQTAASADDKGKGKEIPTPLPLGDQSARPLSRATVLASASGESTRSGQPSPMGRQTPISPADRNFLLGYLQSVSNSATH